MFTDDVTRLRHMLDAAREAVAFASGRDRAELDDERLLVLGLVKCIEIVGEAAARVTPETQARYPTLPWTDIVGMRNRLVHGYFEVDVEQVWQTIQHDLPDLIGGLEQAIEAETDS